MELTRLFHYTSINNLALILSSKQIRFNRLDKVNDPTEGLTADFHNLAAYIFVSCWTNTEDENLALWNMYTPQMRGVRIELPLQIFTSYSINSITDFLVPEDKIVDEEKSIFVYGGENSSIKIEYTDEPEKLKPKIRTELGLKTDLLGRYKSKIWCMENEYRYKLEIVPIDPNIKSDSIPDRYNELITNKTPPSIDSYYIKINQNSFSSMKILLSPKIIKGDFEIVSALVEKYNPKATIYESNLKGLIR